MKPNRKAVAAGFAALALLALVGGGCANKVSNVFLPNQPPEVRLTQAPLSQKPEDKVLYGYRMSWVGFDPDGRIDHFVIAVDPRRADSVETNWQVTRKNEEFVFFTASQPDTTNVPGGSLEDPATDFHTFAIAAVDDKGAVSKPVWRAFYSFTVAPRTLIDEPRPNFVFTPVVTPTVRIRWHGTDDDGFVTQKPVKYKYKLFSANNPDFPEIKPDFTAFIVSDPDFLRRTYGPTFGPSEKCPTCTVWDSTNAETTDVQFTNLIPGQTYLFAVTSFDEAGAFDPIFSPSSNLLRFVVSYAGTLGPRILMFNEFFFYEYQTGGYSQDPSRYFNVEVPADQAVTFNWLGIPPQGADIRRYRWAMDLQDLTDETRRTNEDTDWYHWSAYSLNTTSATVGPFFNNGEQHFFYIECEDNNGLRSLGIINFTVVRATFEKEVLFVDDTRLQLDQRPPSGGLDPPRGAWPTQAELDTFLFAQGGFPWKGYPGYGTPNPTLSQPGIFRGYEFDTMGTRGIITGIVPLARLGKYKRVVWYTDDVAATYMGFPTDPFTPISSLRQISSPGQPSTISTYLKQGGEVWLMGGGAAFATLTPWNKRGSDPGIFSFTDGELVPGRFMYDFAKWQSEVQLRPATQAQRRGVIPGGLTAISRGWSGAPDYSKLPATLTARSLATDPVPPLRQNDSFYYIRNYTAEYLTRGNFIREDVDTLADVVLEQSTLDTLYTTAGGTAQIGRPNMTFYHGPSTPRLVFSGFALWFFQRGQIIPLADFVMHDIWGYPQPPAGSRDRIPGPLSASRARIPGPLSASRAR